MACAHSNSATGPTEGLHQPFGGVRETFVRPRRGQETRAQRGVRLESLTYFDGQGLGQETRAQRGVRLESLTYFDVPAGGRSRGGSQPERSQGGVVEDLCPARRIGFLLEGLIEQIQGAGAIAAIE